MKEALSRVPDHWEMRSLLGSYFFKAGRFEEALTQFQETVRLNPGYAPAGLNLARTWVALEKPEQAKA